MPFLGTTPTQGFVGANPKQSFTANGSTTVFTLTRPVANANDLEVFVGNVRQEPTAAYSAAGTTLTMTEAPDTGLNFYVINKSQAQVTTTLGANSVSTSQLINSAVTDAKIGGMAASKLTGALPAISGASLTGAGGMQLLLDSAIGNVVNFDVSSTYINSTYDSYIVHIHAQPNGDNKYLQMQVFVGGTIQTGSIYGYEGQYAASGAGFGGNTESNWGFQAYGSGNSAGYGTTAHIQISNVNSTDFGCAMTAMCNYSEHTGGAHQGGLSCGHIIPANRANVINGFRFNFHSGTIQTGHIKVYGLRT